MEETTSLEAIDGGEPVPEFEFRVGLTPEEVVQAFAADTRVAWHEEGQPGGVPEPGPQFQAWPAGERGLVIRHAVRNASLGASPNVHIQWEPQPQGGTLIRGRFLKRAAAPNDRMLVVVSPVVLAALALWALVVDRSFIPHSVAGLIGYVVFLRARSNRPTPKSMHHFGRALWSLVGQKFIPNALGASEDDPFRDR